MKRIEKKSVILNAMVILVLEGETLCTGNEGDFSEYASANNFDLDLVKEVYNEHDEYLNALYLFNNKQVKLDEISNFLDVSVDYYRDEILESCSLDNGHVNFCFDFINKEDPLYNSIVQVTDIFEL